MSTVADDWWRGAVIYQIYPRSFMDSNGDGIGDLAGITSRLDYVADLGVDAIWISPFFQSPMKDFGYDISDYRAVDPIFGELADFERLVERAHTLGLRVIIDQVLSHSSDQHPWFAESRRSRSNEKSDWYVWADPKPDGNPPNNWLSIFGGPAWTWDSRRRQYYLHNFLESQPDLNFHHPPVREAQLDNLRYWLDLGVDGFRLDVVNFYFHDPALRSNPPTDSDEFLPLGLTRDNPYAYQRHLHDISQPENLEFLKSIRTLLDDYDSKMTVGEITGDDPLGILADYTAGNDRLHMAYTFALLTDNRSASYLQGLIGDVESRIGQGWPCWAISNHDVKRCVTRWGGDGDAAGLARVAVAMLCCLRGSPSLYQGDELGLPEADVPYERLRDPYGLPFWPEYRGRDGCRTPMVWQAKGTEFGGFSTVEPWLPVSEAQLPLSVERQQNQSDSTLNWTRRFLAWRRQQPALIRGESKLLDIGSDLLCWIRSTDEQSLLLAFNLSGEPARARLPVAVRELVTDLGFTGRIDEGELVLGAYDALIARMA